MAASLLISLLSLGLLPSPRRGLAAIAHQHSTAMAAVRAGLAPAAPAPNTAGFGRRAAVVGASAAALLRPPAALASKDCYTDCSQNCVRNAPNSVQYCKDTCNDYCAQTDRRDGLSGSAVQPRAPSDTA
mmetsp:Transcript_30122/g.74209  ORF Transcript_30122/g.74209 Transcript_30122/m.74209 type:complete len:129 (+) Transcript_30122:1-387(+)